MRAVVVGSLNADLVLAVDAIPEPGMTIASTGVHRFPGGKGANQAVALARLGASVAMVGAVGDDDDGAFLRGVLRQEGVDVDRVRTVAGVPSGLAVITVDGRGENAIVVVAGANASVGADAIAPGDLAGADLVVLQLEIPIGGVLAAARHGRAAGARIVLNAAPAVPMHPDLLHEVDALVVNASEARLLSGADDPIAAAAALRDAGPSVVVVTLGAGGAIVDDGRCVRVAAFPADVVDTTGAGDCFTAGFAIGLADGLEAAAAARFAAAAAGLAVSRRGAQAMPTRAEVESFLDLQASVPPGGIEPPHAV